MAETWTIQRVLVWTSDYFQRKALDSPRLTAELLLASVLGCPRVRLYMEFDRPLNKDELTAFRALVERRAAGEPTHYLLGARDFFGRSFQVDPRVLIPRPETELLVELALERLPEDAPGPVLDLCTGTGCIALTLAAERPGLRVLATDLSQDALAVARANAERLNVADRVQLLHGDLWAPVPAGPFALVVSNPPYVRRGAIDGLMPEVRREPRSALDGGPDGLDLLRQIIAGAPERLAPGGWLLLEHGEEQGPAVRQLLEAAGLSEAQVRRDLAGLDRMALARRP